MIHALWLDLADMHEAVFLAKEVHEGAEINDFDDFTFVDRVHFWISRQAVDPFAGRVDRLLVR